MSASDRATVDAETLRHEEIVARAPGDVEAWTRYVDALPRASASDDDAHDSLCARFLTYERGIRHNPGSYKLWYFYLVERVERGRGWRCDDARHAGTEAAFERALTTMHKMPKVWELYITYLMTLRYVTKTRRACDRALQALPVTQHERVWTLYLRFIRSDARVPGDTARRVYRRYLKFEPGHAEEYVEFLRKRGYHGEVATKLAELVNDDSFQSLAGKTKHAMWLELCDVVTKNPTAGAGVLDVDAILRGGIAAFTDEVGRLWTALADYYIRRGLFEKARDVYEEAMERVRTVRDFSLVFDAYAQFEESVISAKMENGEGMDEDDEGEDEGSDAAENFAIRDLLATSASVAPSSDLELRLARLEHLMERRPILLSSVMLRQNPHNVLEWEKRVQLYEGDPMKQIVTFTDAIKTVDPMCATGRVSNLWIEFAKFYETHGDAESAKTIFEKACETADFKTVDDLARCWTEYAEFCLRQDAYDDALAVMRRATTAPAHARRAQTSEEYAALTVREKAYKSLKLWTLYVDLEESLGTLESTKKVYESMIALKVATPQIILNYAHLLQEKNFFEDAFQIYEKGVSAFKFPYSKEIWSAYLTQFVARFKGTKLERARDLFEQCLEHAPPKHAKEFFMAYAKLEEEFGLGKRAMDVYDRACRTVPVDERLSVYDVYVNRAMEFFGVAKVRDVFTRAAEDDELPANVAKTLAVRFAEFERKLGELDRARALYAHASQFSDPTKDAEFWSTWHEFEVRHGNEETFREMLRVKRAVAASFSDTHYNVSVVAPDVDAVAADQGAPPANAMAALDREHEARAVAASGVAVHGFVRSHVEGASEPNANEAAAAGDDAEIDLDDVLGGASVPSAVFEGAGAKRTAEDASLGAMERFKRAREEQ
ncbi:hypothetical protein BE221DRAFT_194353 [Ostreococcus tauri]|uniref:Tetratricopeptide repeat n=1 Tax=Ostreococcus tauri TaxID=70448 RepID=A0A1Y5I9I7_OSTTA|nr:hypothetical protein BE221DRAFT_194353 [Ostreococcus tauri]